MKKSSYESLGVSASKSGLHDVLDKTGLSDSLGLFAKVTSDLAADPDYHCFVHCDGAGTKSIVPYLFFRETEQRELFAGLAQDALVMNLDDIYCIGTPEKLLLANTLGRNSNLIDDDIIAIVISSYKELCNRLRELGIPLEITGGETADCGDIVRTLMVDAVICGRIKKENLINAQSISPGDAIVGLSCTGTSSYEDQENSGIGSNGLTLARHALLTKDYADKYPEVFDPLVDRTLIYRGPFRVSDQPKGLGMSVGEALASPTRTYAPVLNTLLNEQDLEIHGIIHLTGGGQTKILRFGHGNLYIKDNLFDPPPIFRLIQEYGSVPWKEMYQVFNMGHRMELYVPEECIEVVVETAARFGIAARKIGYVAKLPDGETDKNKLCIDSIFGSFEFEL